MKLHYNLLVATADSLNEIFFQNAYADKVLERILKSNARWGKRDRAFIAENTYECVRWWRLYWALLGEDPKDELDDLVKLIGVGLIHKGNKIPDWEEFKGIDIVRIEKRFEKYRSDFAIINSYPDWLVKRCEEELPKIAHQELKALNEPASLVLRVNTLKVTKQQVQDRLVDDEFVVYPVKNGLLPPLPHALLVAEKGNVFATQAFKSGFFEVQDAGSQCIAQFLQVSPGMRVIDACAGAGGKTLHLAALMGNKGKVIAMDTVEWKLKELSLRAKRNGVTCVEPKVITSNKIIKRLHDSADRLLLDVPCSGTGVLKRNPDAKWKLSNEFIDKIIQTQQQILSSYSAMLKVGGLMVYATCSLLPSENEQQVQAFLSKNDAFELIEEKHIFPSYGFDGFYMALLKRLK